MKQDTLDSRVVSDVLVDRLSSIHMQTFNHILTILVFETLSTDLKLVSRGLGPPIGQLSCSIKLASLGVKSTKNIIIAGSTASY